MLNYIGKNWFLKILEKTKFHWNFVEIFVIFGRKISAQMLKKYLFSEKVAKLKKYKKYCCSFCVITSIWNFVSVL